ncbi:MAG: hypothetical protein KTR16_07695, partial [Acidiferrobacterales bacterium]|nr:hypothetical protein [Acidiferrobacterales bacterium]
IFSATARDGGSAGNARTHFSVRPPGMAEVLETQGRSFQCDRAILIERRYCASMHPRHTVRPEHTLKIAPAFSGYRPSMGIKKAAMFP